MTRKLAFVLSLFTLLSSFLYAGLNSVEVRSSDGYPVAPDFALTDIDGNAFSLNDYSAKVVLLEFFRTSCSFCINQTSHLKILNEEFDEKLVIISISTENGTILRGFREAHSINWTIAEDTSNVFDMYNVSGIPTLVIIDQGGYICYRHVGLTEKPVLSQEIKEILLPVHNLDMGKDYATIQEAINANETLPGHTILVDAGTHYEHVIVDKSISLIGENKDTTIINGNYSGTVIRITASDVNITNFSVKNSGQIYSAIVIDQQTTGTNISSNIITNNFMAIRSYNSASNIVSGNNIINNSDGISLHWSSFNSISRNNITNNGEGVNFYSSSNNNTLCGNQISDNDFGIRISSSSNNTIYRNNITNNEDGFGLFSSSLNRVCVNSMMNNSFGMLLYGSSQNTFCENKITNGADGILSIRCSNNIFSGNNITDNEDVGVSLSESSNNYLSENLMNANKLNLQIWGNELSHYVHSIDFSNRINGKPIYYFLNQKNLVINAVTYPEVGFLALINSSDCHVAGLALKDNEPGILLAGTSNSKITGNNIINNQHGILLFSSSSNTIYGNNIKNNSYYGIELISSFYNNLSGNIITNDNGVLLTSSSFNAIFGNNIINNSNTGLWLYSSSNNEFYGNNIVANSYGVGFAKSSNNVFSENNIIDSKSMGVTLYPDYSNRFYHNNFINNTEQVGIAGSGRSQFWDDGLEGNYWSNYTGVDSDYDGIGDTDYVIDENNTDRYPLMGVFHSLNTSLGYHVNVISNSTIEDFGYFESNSTIKMYVSNMTTEQTFGFCRVCIPKELIVPPYNVTINDGEIEVLYFNDTIHENDTHRWIYFAYEHSVLEIIIIPEFPSFLILPLFIIATLLAVIVYRRLYSKRRELGKISLDSCAQDCSGYFLCVFL